MAALRDNHDYSPMSDLVCPKCQGAMRQYERNGVTVDQCADCRGLFLDRGELERLIDAESRWSAGAGGATAPATPAAPPVQPVQPVIVQQHKPYRRKSFLEELFD